MFPRPDFMTPDRLQRGYVVVLPGIEGYSHWNKSIVRGLVAGGVPYAIEIHDWTYGRLATLVNFFARRRHRQQVELIRQKIIAYREQHPDAPVYVIGHSGGGAMAVFTLCALPENVVITGGVLIGAAISREFDMLLALRRTEQGIRNFSSWGDVLFLGGSTLAGNLDQRWTFAAGMSGFSKRVHAAIAASGVPRIEEIPFRSEFILSRNLGGHFGGVAQPFVRAHIAPWICESIRTDPGDRQTSDHAMGG